MIKYILISVISFCLVFLCRGIKKKTNKRNKSKKVLPLSKQNFKDAMDDLEIK